MTTFSQRFTPFAERMRAEGLPEIFIRSFAHYYDQLVEGQTGLIPESSIRPVASLPDVETFAERLAHVGQEALSRTVMLKLNGGLGTSMGLEQAKSLLVVKERLTFLDIIALQALQADVPLLLMNSFATHADALALLEKYPRLWQHELPLDFLQHKVPKVTQTNLSPVCWPENPELEWCPPGHGDIYTSLATSGALDALLNAGYEYAFVSNADNLGAVMDPALLGYLVENQLPFMMEVADRTEMDKKGGHLAQRPDGQLILRESAQCPPEDSAAFQDVGRHKYFNTNNLWLCLPVLKQVLQAQDYWLGLPMIRNAKTVDPRDSESTPVYQVETAMGSAIGVFAGAQAVRVPRYRFAPVKATDDLLAVRSDAYCLTDDYRVIPDPARPLGSLSVDLDPDYYKFVNELDERFPHGAPSLIACKRLRVEGDIVFGRQVICRGDVTLINESDRPALIPDGTLLAGEKRYS